MRTLAIINQKGGCGKTTTAINLSAVLARQGHRTLLIDMDPQGHCAAGLGIPEQRFDLDITDALQHTGSRAIDMGRLLWRPARNLDLIPSRMRLAGIEARGGGIADAPDRERRLAGVLGGLASDYDVAVIDCPPSIGLLAYNALAAADLVVVPVETGYFSLQGASRQVQTVKSISRRLGRPVAVWVLATIHDTANSVAGDLLEEMVRRFKGLVLPTVIRRDTHLREAASFGQAVIDYAPASHGAEDYSRLASWVLSHLHVEARLEDAPDESNSVDGQLDAAPAETTAVVPSIPAPVLPAEVQAALAAVSQPAELKPISRAEDVARRAQEFLRKVATGGRSGGTPSLATAPSTPSVLPSRRELAPTPVVLSPESAVRTITLNAGIQRVLGAHATNQGVVFAQPLACGQNVVLVGSFNGWSSGAHPLRRNNVLGVHELCLRLPPGRHLYRLIIDGAWSADPYNDRCEPNPFGEMNSVIDVPAPVAPQQTA